MTIHIEYMRLDDFLNRMHPRNPKDHDLGAITTSIDRFGFVEIPVIDERTGLVVAGHGRGETLQQQMNAGKQPPARIQVDEFDGMWMIPVQRGVSFNSDAERDAYLVASNRLVELGGWDNEGLASMLQSLANEDKALLEVTGYDGDDLDELLKIVPNIDFPEYDENIADTVEMCTCPNCGHEFPK